ncbi:MAG: hypothetical protein J2O49_04450 [Sciscionella sp.]|nr:hypothetical protein [Sciscionella sp.]
MAGLTRQARGRKRELPTTEYSLSTVDIDPVALAAYDKVCEFRLTDELPATYPHVLGFPLQTKLMTDDDFPFPLIGLVHVANRITQRRPIRVDDRPTIKVHVENLRPHPKGRQFDMISEASLGGEAVWTDVSTYLRRGETAAEGVEGAGGDKPAGGVGSAGPDKQAGSVGSAGPDKQAGGEKPKHRKESAPEAGVPNAIWRVPDDIGRRYAEVAGDANPIHLHPLTAKAFGFPRAIAHGMWAKARCLAAFEGRLPDAYTVDVRFKLPVLLPGKVAFTATQVDRGWHFLLTDARSDKPHLEGTITPA